MKIGFVVAAIIRIEVAEKIVGEEIAREIAEFGHEFLANLRRVRPFIFPEQSEAEKVVCVRRPGIQSQRAPEFADGVVLHFRVAIRVAEKYVKRSGIAHGRHDHVENLRGFFCASRILQGKQ